MCSQPAIVSVAIGLQILLWGNLASLDDDESAEKTSAQIVDETTFLR